VFCLEFIACCGGWADMVFVILVALDLILMLIGYFFYPL